MLLTFGLVACGGGGGGASVPPAATTANVELQPVIIGAGQTVVDLTVSLAQRSEPGPALLQATLVLPPELSLPATERLAPATPVVTLDGDFTNSELTNSEFTILCGDASNQDAQPLPVGPLFQIRLMPTSPRQPGTYIVTLKNVRAATSSGSDVPLALTTLTATVTIQ
ncbi:MAG: hypothetical protein ACI8UD_003324 [Planctomycetota bacterium]|jgi:hypothetical protein